MRISLERHVHRRPRRPPASSRPSGLIPTQLLPAPGLPAPGLLATVLIGICLLASCQGQSGPPTAASPAEESPEVGTEIGTERQPELAGVTRVEVRAKPSGAEGPWAYFAIEDRYTIDLLIAQIRAIDWSQEGDRLAEIRLIPPDIDLTFFGQFAQPQYSCQLYWSEDLFVDQSGGRLLQADLTHVRLQLVGALIEHAADSAQHTRLDASSDVALERSLRIMEVGLSPAERQSFRQCLEWYENPYSNPLFDGALSDERWIDLPRYKKYDSMHQMNLAELRAHLHKVVPGCAEPPAAN